MDAYGEVEIYLHLFLTLALDTGERLVLRSRCFIPKYTVCCTHWISGWLLSWMDASRDIDFIRRWKYLALARNRTPNGPTRTLVTTDCAVPGAGQNSAINVALLYRVIKMSLRTWRLQYKQYAQSDSLAADRQGQGDTRRTITPSVIPQF
jgi:hypothetical protein